MTAKRLNKIATLAVMTITTLSCASAPTAQVPSPPANRPGLVVLVVVDQLSADLFDRYADLYTGGFKRLRESGHSFANAAHDHAITVTAPGHATLSTGVYPSRHGVISNLWLEKSGSGWVPVENIADSTAHIVGVTNARGASPVHLMRSGFAEWLVQANSRSKVASVSGKDRGAIQPAAHARSAYVYWFDGGFKRFVTTSYYHKADPDWVTRFNKALVEGHRADTVWRIAAPASTWSRSNRDTLDYEADGVMTFFPHRYRTEGDTANFWTWWENTPQVDAATLDMAEAMVTSLDLGRDDAPDFLNVSLSATDRIGHRFGPLSREQMDNLLRLDRELGEFFDFLDKSVGRNRWSVVLTADHGVVDSPEDLIARGEYGHRLTAAENKTLDSLRARADSSRDKKAAARELVAALKRLSIIGDAWTQEELLAQPRDSFALLQRRSMYPGREAGRFSRQGVEFRYRAGIYGAPKGSGHGSPYWYDRHVPFIFMGPGITAGRDVSKAATVDFAPTVSSLLGIAYPKDLDGKVLSLK